MDDGRGDNPATYLSVYDDSDATVSNEVSHERSSTTSTKNWINKVTAGQAVLVAVGVRIGERETELQPTEARKQRATIPSAGEADAY